jgi:hypothetical protein
MFYVQHLDIAQTIQKKTGQHFMLQMWELQTLSKKIHVYFVTPI